MSRYIVDVISFQKIFGLCGLKCHIVEIWTDVTFEDRGRTDGNVNIELESAKQDSQLQKNAPLLLPSGPVGLLDFVLCIL